MIYQKRYKLFLGKSPRKFYDEYFILGDTENSIIVKHLKCGGIYRFSKSVSKFKLCRHCKVSEEKLLQINENEKGSVNYQRFLTAKEYAFLRGKEQKQIRIYCKDERIPGVIRTVQGYLIPNDAPYPEDRRVNNMKNRHSDK